jgi:P4 family phage/plasmid primase-like protien
MSVSEKWEIVGSPLTEFLKEKTTTNNKDITHQLLPKVLPNFPYYKFHISKDEYPAFIKLYHQHVVEMRKPLSLMEIMGDVCPMYLDIDIKYGNPDKNIVDKQYTKDTVELICKAVVNEVRNHVILESGEGKPDPFYTIVMEKPRPIIKENFAKDGIHIIFPNIVIHRKLQQHIIRELCLEKNATLTKPIIDTLKSALYDVKSEENLLKYIMDESIYKSGKMIMLGSMKPDNVPYEVTQILSLKEISGSDTGTSKMDYDVSCSEISEYDSYTLLEHNSLYNNPEKVAEYFDDTENIISGNSHSAASTCPAPEQGNADPTPIRNGHADSLIPGDRETCKALVNLLNVDRCDEYNSWVAVGICLKNISNSLLELWKDFSKKSNKYQSGECEKRWLSDFKDCNYSGSKLKIASLYYWAISDNPQGYDIYNKNLLRNDVRISVKNKGPQADVAQVVYNSAKHSFVCAGIKTQEWYFFNKETTRWEYMDGAIMLRRYINNVVTDLFAHYLQEYNDKATELHNEGEEDAAELWEKRAKTCCKIFTNLKTTSFKDNVVKECRDLYYDKDFLEELDANTHLIGFENCVFDLQTGQFRLGEPGDFVSLSCGITIDLYDRQRFPIKLNKYYKTYKKTEGFRDNNAGLEDFLNKILPINEVKEYTLRKIASCLIGDIREEKFHIWTGSGGNGKSKLIDLIEKVFGDYACKLPVQLLTQKRGQSSGANPELARTQGKRFISMQEPDLNEKINIGLMKELSGGDKVTARRLFKECVDFKPQFTMFLMCNQLPDVPGDDDGTWRRLEVVEFISKFRDKVKPGDEQFNIYKMDMQLTEKLDRWKFPLLMKLLDIFVNKYDKSESEGGGIKVPYEVTKQTKKYRETNDIIAQFMDAEYELSDNTTSISQMYNDFKEWYKESSYDKKTIPKKKEFEEKIIKVQKDTKYGYTIDKKQFNFIEKEKGSESDED